LDEVKVEAADKQLSFTNRALCSSLRSYPTYLLEQTTPVSNGRKRNSNAASWCSSMEKWSLRKSYPTRANM
jgi:hypothetical protein